MKVAKYQNLRSTIVTKDEEVVKYITNHLSYQLDLNFKYRTIKKIIIILNKKKTVNIKKEKSKYSIIEIFGNHYL